MPKVVVSAKQRPPIRSEASSTVTLALVPAIRRAAAMPAAPAPMMATSTSGPDGALHAGAATPAAAEAADAATNRRRLSFGMIDRWAGLPKSNHASTGAGSQFIGAPARRRRAKFVGGRVVRGRAAT